MPLGELIEALLPIRRAHVSQWSRSAAAWEEKGDRVVLTQVHGDLGGIAWIDPHWQPATGLHPSKF